MTYSDFETLAYPKERDACGVGFIADIHGRKTHKTLERAVEALCNLSHRGAVSADGLTGDGAGILILEEYEHAVARGATIYAELAGFGMSDDAYHMTAPPENGEGACLAMSAALKDAHLTPLDVDYINAHGTSTPAGDLAETQAVKTLMGDDASDVAISSTKSMIGHLLGASGAVESIFSILAIRDQVAPPTINLEEPSEGCDLNYVSGTPQKRKIDVVLNNSFGFGGTNGTLVFKKIS